MDMISTWILPKVSFLAYWYHLYAVIPNIYAELSVFASCQANICDMSAKDRGSNGTMRWSRDFESNTHVITHRNEQFQNWSISDVTRDVAFSASLWSQTVTFEGWHVHDRKKKERVAAWIRFTRSRWSYAREMWNPSHRMLHLRGRLNENRF